MSISEGVNVSRDYCNPRSESEKTIRLETSDIREKPPIGKKSRIKRIKNPKPEDPKER